MFIYAKLAYSKTNVGECGWEWFANQHPKSPFTDKYEKELPMTQELIYMLRSKGFCMYGLEMAYC